VTPDDGQGTPETCRVNQNKKLDKVTPRWLFIQGVSRLYVMTAGGDFLGRCDEKIHINMCPILDGCIL
jgi:hypothetical protein